MTPVRVVLAGLGVRGIYWADVLSRSSRCEIAAFADPNPTALENAQARFGEYAAFESAEEAIENISDVGALVLANPPIGRESQVRKAVEYNIPMLIEKPLALDLDEAAQLVRIAESAGVPLMVGLNFRYLSVTIETMRLINEKTVGTPEFAHFTYERYRDGERLDLNKYPLTMDQPMLWEQSIHHFDLMRHIYSQEPVSVQCHTWNPSWSMYKSDANVAAIFTFDGGMVVNYQGTWQSNWKVPHFEWRTECTEGIITQREQFDALHYAKHADAELTKMELPAHEIWVSETIGLLDAFFDTVIEKQPLQCSGRDHIMSLAMLEACIVSSREGRRVTIESILPEF
jgi:predicted dehydrogenase